MEEVQTLPQAVRGLSSSDTDATRSSISSSSKESTLKAHSSLSGKFARADDASTVSASSVHLNIETPAELREFLRELRKDFLDKVIPEETAFIDRMLSSGCLTPSDYGSLNGKHVHTPTDQARKLWLIFNKMSVEDFKAVVFPELYGKFPHIIPKKFCTPVAEGSRRGGYDDVSSCLRHDIMFVARPSSMADVLIEYRCITLEMYQEVVSDLSKLSDSALWSKLFSAFSGHTNNITTQLAEELCKMLKRYRPAVTQDLAERQVVQGVPCTCQLTQDDLPPGAPPFQLQITTAAEERDPISSHSENNPNRLTTNIFQIPGSQYLGSDDPDFRLSEPDPAFKTWVSNEGLSEDAFQMLVREGFLSRDDLAMLEGHNIEECLPRFHNLEAKQKLILKKLIEMVETKVAHVPGLSEALSDVVRLLLVGKSGAGKSSSGNTILGKDRFSSSLSMGSNTKNCQFEHSEDEKVELIDCPGLFDTSLTLEEVCTVIVQAVLAMLPGPTAILYTLRIGDHYTDEEYETYQRLKVLFGKKVCRYMIVLFTRGDELKKRGISIKEYIQGAPERFKKVLRECGGRYVVFDNTPEGKNSQQIDELREKVTEIMTRDDRSHFKLQMFSAHRGDIEAEIRRRFAVYGTFKAKQQMLQEGEETPEEGSIFWMIWIWIRDILKTLAARLSGTG